MEIMRSGEVYDSFRQMQHMIGVLIGRGPPAREVEIMHQEHTAACRVEPLENLVDR